MTYLYFRYFAYFCIGFGGEILNRDALAYYFALTEKT
jgi:hypothetical protein